MAKNKPKAAKNCEIKPWLSERLDHKEGRYIQVGNSLMLSKRFQVLKPNTRFLYLCMALESGGKPNVQFSHGAAQKYGIPSTSFERAAKELQEAGFISLEIDEERSQFKTNIYRFINDWKLKPAPHFGEGK